MSSEKTGESIRQKIDNILKNKYLNGKSITLLAASKSQTVPVIIEAIEAGISHFGENKVQEAEDKWPAIKGRFPELKLHLIGPLQSNKVKQALALFDVIQTIDRPKLAEEIAKELASKRHVSPAGQTSPERAPWSFQQEAPGAKKMFIQVNTGEEPQKAGVLPRDADELIEHCKALGLPVVGLMCIPPHNQPPAPHFALLKQIADRHGLKELSMGMSDDFETAARMGSTCVRLGRILFGERN